MTLQNSIREAPIISPSRSLFPSRTAVCYRCVSGGVSSFPPIPVRTLIIASINDNSARFKIRFKSSQKASVPKGYDENRASIENTAAANFLSGCLNSCFPDQIILSRFVARACVGCIDNNSFNQFFLIVLYEYTGLQSVVKVKKLSPNLSLISCVFTVGALPDEVLLLSSAPLYSSLSLEITDTGGKVSYYSEWPRMGKRSLLWELLFFPSFETFSGRCSAYSAQFNETKLGPYECFYIFQFWKSKQIVYQN